MDLMLDESTWDLATGDTDLLLVDGRDAIGQHLAQRLKTFLGEWFLDLRIGVPYFQQVMVKNPDPLVLDSVFKSEIINTPGVTELLSFDLKIDAGSRLLQLSFSAATDDGVITFSEVLP
jgi:hypothetical protein